jgi:hypothetical protein
MNERGPILYSVDDDEVTRNTVLSTANVTYCRVESAPPFPEMCDPHQPG